MGKIIIKEQASADTPSSGNMAIYPKTDGKLYSKNDSGSEVLLSTEGISESIINAKGDLIVGSADDTATILQTPTLSAGDGNRVLVVKDTDDETLVWTEHKSNGIKLGYINAATYTIDYAADHIIVGVYASGDMTFTFPDPTFFPTTGRGKEYIFKNGDTTGKILTVKLYGTGVFQNGLNEIKVYNRGTLRVGMVRPNIADGALLLQDLCGAIQVRRNSTWAASNFSSNTAIPFDTNDMIRDDNVMDHSTSSNEERILLKALGCYKITFWMAVNSTGGSSYSVEGYIRINGSTELAGSRFEVGNYQTEDSHVCIGPIYYQSTATTDYYEIMLDQNSLTGNVHDAVTFCEAKI